VSVKECYTERRVFVVYSKKEECLCRERGVCMKREECFLREKSVLQREECFIV